MTKIAILDINGKKTSEMEMPSFFSEKIREDILAKVLEVKKRKQPYGPSQYAGMKYSASGKIKHLRHVWKTSYGKGMSRVPRKIMTRKGSQFNWVGASVPNTRGGRRAHPPRVEAMTPMKKINKKEMKIALRSALAATADEKTVKRKYSTLKDMSIKNLPFVVESKVVSLKTKELLSTMEKILGKEVYNVALRNKELRAGRGKMRGRRYKSNAGMLLVVGKGENVKANAFDVKDSQTLGAVDLAKGNMGRITVYTEEAIKNLDDRLKGK